MEKKMTGADMATRFNPQEIEADIYKAWEESGRCVYRTPGGREEAFHHRYAAAQHYGPAAYGPCHGLHHAGCADPLSPDEG